MYFQFIPYLSFQIIITRYCTEVSKCYVDSKERERCLCLSKLVNAGKLARGEIDEVNNHANNQLSRRGNERKTKV